MVKAEEVLECMESLNLSCLDMAGYLDATAWMVWVEPYEECPRIELVVVEDGRKNFVSMATAVLEGFLDRSHYGCQVLEEGEEGFPKEMVSRGTVFGIMVERWTACRNLHATPCLRRMKKSSRLRSQFCTRRV
jgi:hypothetical protein